jgi:DNA replication protein DnaC
MDRRPLVVLLGPRGVGKSQLAVCLLADICIATSKAVKYMKALDLFRTIRACYRADGADEARTVDQIIRYAGLVIDEAHVRSDTDWENRTLENVLDHRYDGSRPTFLISNLSEPDFCSAIGMSVVSRIQESGHAVVCDWPSFRIAPELMEEAAQERGAG